MYKIELTKNSGIPYFRQLFVFNYIVNRFNNDYDPAIESIKMSYSKRGIVFYVNTLRQVDNIEKLLNNNIKKILETDDSFKEKRDYLLAKYQEVVDQCIVYFCKNNKDDLEDILETEDIQTMKNRLKQLFEASDIENILTHRKGFDAEQLSSIRSMVDEEYQVRPC